MIVKQDKSYIPKNTGSLLCSQCHMYINTGNIFYVNNDRFCEECITYYTENLQS